MRRTCEHPCDICDPHVERQATGLLRMLIERNPERAKVIIEKIFQNERLRAAKQDSVDETTKSGVELHR